jgi:hypothetical protein
MFRCALVGVLCLLSGSALAQSQGGAAPVAAGPANTITAMEEPLPGDYWAYEIRDEITGKITYVRTFVITEVTPTEISVRSSDAGNVGGDLNVYDRSWNLKSRPPWKWQPHDGSGIKSPLKVGDSWRFQADDVNPANGHIWKRSGQAKVVGQETITAKAGTFDTFKVETVISRYPTNDPTRKREVVWHTWYALAINHWVKRTFVVRENKRLATDTSYELTEYGRRK